MSAALASLLSALSLRSDDTDHEAILKACNEALRENKNNAEAQHARVVALLKLDRFEDALRQLEDGGASLQEKAPLEYAYTLYKLGRLEEAKVLAGDLHSRGGKLLDVQASYRLEDFEAAAKILKELRAEDVSQEENDLRINTTANDAQLEWQRREELVSNRKPSLEDLEAFETAFNVACASIARGELPQAEKLLARAKTLCLALDFSDEDRKAELLPISVQQLFIYVLLNKTEQAEALAKEFETDVAPTSSTTQIAQINRIAADKKRFNPFLSSRVLKAKPNLPPSDQFFDYQSSLFSQNEVALEFLSGKFSGIESTTSKKLQSQSGPTASSEPNVASSANAAAHAQLELGKPGIRSISPLLRKRPHDLGLVATLVQLYISTKNHGSAIKLVDGLCNHLEQSGTERDLDVRYAPGLVAIITSLYSIEGRKSGVKDELSKAATHWRQKSRNQPSLMKAAGHALIRSGRPDDIAAAKAIFTSLSKDLPSDKFVTTGLIASSASSDPVAASRNASTLPPINKLIAGIDIEALDAAGIPQPVSTATILSRKRAADATTKPAKKRIRKSRLPKDYDPEKKVDPERWLPMRDRSYYKPKKQKKKGKGATQGASQGAIAADDAPAAAKPAQASGGGGGGGGSSKKKGKKKNK